MKPSLALVAALLSACSAATTSTPPLSPPLPPTSSPTASPVVRPLEYVSADGESVLLLESADQSDPSVMLTASLVVFISNQGPAPVAATIGAPSFDLGAPGFAVASNLSDRVWCGVRAGESIDLLVLPPNASTFLRCWWTSRPLASGPAPGMPAAIDLRLPVDGADRAFRYTVSAQRTRRYTDPSARFLLSYPIDWVIDSGAGGNMVDFATTPAALRSSPGSGECKLHLARDEGVSEPAGDPTELQIGERRYRAFESVKGPRRLVQGKVDVFAGTWLVRAECVDPAALENMRLIRTLILPLWRPATARSN